MAGFQKNFITFLPKSLAGVSSGGLRGSYGGCWRMKLLVAFVSATLLLADAGLRAEEALRGDLLEIHSCQLYIGGCIASAEATQDGRYLLRVWSFSGGSHNGVPLAGLQVALLETGDQNLADKDTSANASL